MWWVRLEPDSSLNDIFATAWAIWNCIHGNDKTVLVPRVVHLRCLWLEANDWNLCSSNGTGGDSRYGQLTRRSYVKLHRFSRKQQSVAIKLVRFYTEELPPDSSHSSFTQWNEGQFPCGKELLEVCSLIRSRLSINSGYWWYNTVQKSLTSLPALEIHYKQQL